MKKKDLFSIKIKTRRLHLVPISLKYKKDIFREFTDKVTFFMFPAAPKRIEETEEFILKSIKEMKKGQNLQVVILDEHEKFIGGGGLHHIDKKTPEIGIWLKKSSHGKGYGKDVVFALKKWADKNLDYKYLLYPVDKDNIASRKIPESMNGEIFKKYNLKNKNGKVLHLLEFRIFKN